MQQLKWRIFGRTAVRRRVHAAAGGWAKTRPQPLPPPSPQMNAAPLTTSPRCVPASPHQRGSVRTPPIATKTAAPNGSVPRLACCARTAIQTGATPVPYRFGCTVLPTRLRQFGGISGLICGNQGDVRTPEARRRSIAARVHLLVWKRQLCRCQGGAVRRVSLFFGGPPCLLAT